ncbi:MAG TPA: family 3 encapsulin nanocompartment shell protein [Jatrophihabitans sp.]|uniref:family 3 encapsulin nanocompartment shell protein n=1 Tax=Jatrophihabitans sp. TaxID=1932789 RepID=UPI002F01358F
MADRRSQMSPGRHFFEAYRKDGLDAVVDFDVTVTDALPSLRRKPRFPVRNMLKIVNLSEDPRQLYWHETTRQPGDPEVTFGQERRELANHFHLSPIPELLTTTAWVQVPDGLWQDAHAFESFINYRLIIRLCTAENYTILCGETGLLSMPQIPRITSKAPFTSTIMAACDEIEQMGCTADGLVLNPVDYYRYLESSRLMDTLERNGVFIVRTRLVEPGTALVGDFGHGAELFDAGRSTIRFAEPPPGTFNRPGIAVKAEIYERVVVNLPFTFYLVTL